ncbi:MAG: hypothetical protein ABMA13_21475 [Chthoniobacteraceae bacterium]
MLPTAADLAPGDSKSAELDLAAFDVHRIRSIDDPRFEAAYAPLWAEFGAKHEMERRETLAARFRLAPAMTFEMVLVEQGGEFAAVRDHTAIPAERETVVHLSHNLVAPAFRRSGLAGWMRAFPVALARELRPGAPVTLAAEMEYDDGTDPDRAIRLRAYENAGFRKVDPARVHYHQPDFRTPSAIDASSPQPVPFQLLLRRVGREDEAIVSGAEVRAVVRALYAMYGAQFRPQDMTHPALDLAPYPAPDSALALLPPTA